MTLFLPLPSYLTLFDDEEKTGPLPEIWIQILATKNKPMECKEVMKIHCWILILSTFTLGNK